MSTKRHEDIKELARQERNKYHREYRKKNKEKIAAINQRYWEKRALKNKGE